MYRVLTLHDKNLNTGQVLGTRNAQYKFIWDVGLVHVLQEQGLSFQLKKRTCTSSTGRQSFLHRKAPSSVLVQVLHRKRSFLHRKDPCSVLVQFLREKYIFYRNMYKVYLKKYVPTHKRSNAVLNLCWNSASTVFEQHI
jgi:hypothetical protein